MRRRRVGSVPLLSAYLWRQCAGLLLSGRGLLILLVLMLSACADSRDPANDCGACGSTLESLSAADVEAVIARAVTEAGARGVAATVAVVDRAGNVLALFQMTGADPDVAVAAPYARNGGLENITFIPSTLSAISKAVTGAYLSSSGNAFSTRTAGQIIQEFFNPGEIGQPGGPLFGVQFSQLGCGDVALRLGSGTTGPKRAPLGLAADPGGFPLYRNGAVVGGVGVEIDGQYSFDADISNLDADIDELVALAATLDQAAPPSRRADRITADGKVLRYSDAVTASLLSANAVLPAFASLPGALLDAPGYYSATGGVLAGVAFGSAASGIRPDAGVLFPGRDAYLLVDAANNNRYPPIAANDSGIGLTAAEVQALLDAALAIGEKSRAQIRQPLGTWARISIGVVDTNGVILGMALGADAPLFGVDVAIQKARTVAFFSGNQGSAELAALPTADYLGPVLVAGAPVVATSESVADYVTALENFLALPTVLADGDVAFSARAVGNLSRPFYPDGVAGHGPGPLSKPITDWSPFSTGLQLDVAYNQLISHIAFAAGLSGSDAAVGCSAISRSTLGGPVDPLANGLQIFPGAVPVYRGNILVGAIGVSGDGVDQDDMAAFLAVDRVSSQLAGDLRNAAPSRRSDTLAPGGTPLRFVQCPQAPFIGSSEQYPCSGK